MKREIFIGTLQQGGNLRTDSGEILLTKIPLTAAQSPESAVLEIAEEHIGKIAVVRGDISGDVLYSAEIVEILPPITSALFQSLIDQEIISFERMKKQLEEIESGEIEEETSKKRCALVIGHKKNSSGAKNVDSDLSEFDFNDDLAIRIEKNVKTVEVQRVYRRTYKELPDDINDLEPDFVVSLHCNAFNTKVSGTEVLYYHKSEKGKKTAGIILNHLTDNLKLPSRGIKPKTSEDRGGYLLRHTNAPCVIAEPFFIDNDNDLARVKEDMEGLVIAYAKAIDEISQVV